ncbi:hypothetical protein ES708_10540 [subsurface metagenome]
MLISFTIENWMSFRDRVTFSMIASKERNHNERVSRITKYGMRLLPVAGIYGGNASGKTNLFKAINFAKDLIVRGTQPDSIISLDRFRLDTTCANKPSYFCFQILLDNVIYEYSFWVTEKSVIEEKLVKVITTREKILYHRKEGKTDFIDPTLKKDKFLDFVSKGTRDNQLLLTNSISQKVNTFKPIYDWFNESLILIGPEARYENFDYFLKEENPLYASFNTILNNLDTGIVHLGGEKLLFENDPFLDSLKQSIKDNLKENTSVKVFSQLNNQSYIITRENGETIVKKLVSYHRNQEGKDVKFDIINESDGSRRLIDLIPAFLALATKSSTVFIDELDRSLHTLVTRQLLSSFLGFCSTNASSQLLFTTHDVLLMDQKLFRRDEMWITERDQDGNSSLLSFSEYKDVRYDKDIRKSYLQGRMGGIPQILLSGALVNNIENDVTIEGN